jgi:hypothetical protein
MVLGQTALTASGRPFSLSQTSMQISRTPRFLISGKMRSQYLALSPSPCSPAHDPSTSRSPSTVTPKARQTGRPAAGDLPVRQSSRRQGNHHVIDPGEPPPPFGDDFRLEAGIPVPRHGDFRRQPGPAGSPGRRAAARGRMRSPAIMGSRVTPPSLACFFLGGRPGRVRYLVRGAVTVNQPLRVAVPAGVVMAMRPLVAPGGTMVTR